MPPAVRPPLEVLYEDNHLLVINKLAGLATMGVSESEPSCWRLGREYIQKKYRKPGNVYLGVVSRLDALVSGVLVFARTSKAAARLSEQIRERKVEKLYWAVTERSLPIPSGSLEDWVCKDEPRQKMAVANEGDRDALLARLSYQQLPMVGPGSLYEISLETGRKHQIRLQLAHQGSPILGDVKYGSRATFPHGIALHAKQLTIKHPVKDELLKISAPLPVSWRQFQLTS